MECVFLGVIFVDDFGVILDRCGWVYSYVLGTGCEFGVYLSGLDLCGVGIIQCLGFGS